MKLIKNQGSDRVIDEFRASLAAGGSLDAATPALSVFAYGELRETLRKLSACRLLIPLAETTPLSLLGSDADRSYRNQLSTHKLARDLAEWVAEHYAGAYELTRRCPSDGLKKLAAALAEVKI